MMRNTLIVTLAAALLFSCEENKTANIEKQNPSESQQESMKFEKLPVEQTGIDFKNQVDQTDSINFFNFEYMFNGGGVAVGDINNDGLTDIYFTGNQVSDKLYINKGDFQFEDITESAIGDIASSGWHTGVNMVDINGDGWLDIYIARSGRQPSHPDQGNLLLINNKDNTFSEKGKAYGVDIERRTTHSAFFDFDNDNDLDLYVMNHPNQTDTKEKRTVYEVNQMIKKGSESCDVFLENIDGKFVDITKKQDLVTILMV